MQPSPLSSSRTFYHPRQNPGAHKWSHPAPKACQPLASTHLRSVCGFAIHMNGILQYVLFCVWLLSLGLTFSKFLHVVACGLRSFLWPSSVPWRGGTPPSSPADGFIRPLVHGHGACFHLGVIVNRAAGNICGGLHVFLTTRETPASQPLAAIPPGTPHPTPPDPLGW